MVQQSIDCALVRGGTSKGVYLHAEALPDAHREEALLSLFGSPDARQIDGLGGGTSTTSKLMAVEAADRPDADVTFTFAQIAVDEPVVDYGGTCGNLTYGVGPFAIREGIVDVPADTTEVTLRLYNTNTEAYVTQTIPLADGQPKTEGDFRVYGVPRTYARIDSTFENPAGADTGALFPLGEPRTTLETAIGPVEVSVVDVVNPVVFARPAAVGLTGTELPAAVDSDPDLLDRIEAIRAAAASELGYVTDPAAAASESPGVPKMAFVSPPQSYPTSTGDTVAAETIDLTARIMSMQKLHPVYAVSGACSTAAAAKLPGTIPAAVATSDTPTVTLGHPKGPLSVQTDVDSETNTVHAVTVPRTQRRLMTGTAYYTL